VLTAKESDEVDTELLESFYLDCANNFRYVLQCVAVCCSVSLIRLIGKCVSVCCSV